MAADCDIAPEGEVLVITFRTPPTIEDVREVVDAVASSDAPRLRLWDLSCGVQFDNREIRQIANAALRQAQPPGSRVALVGPDDLSFGLGRVYAAYRESEQTHVEVFRTREEALAWLRG